MPSMTSMHGVTARSLDADREQVRFHASRRIAGLDILHARFLTHQFSRHAHDGYALGVITQGALAFRFLGRDHVAACGTLNLVVPGEVHDGHGADASGWAYRMFYMTPALVQRAAAEAGLPGMDPLQGTPGGWMPGFCSGVLQDAELAANLVQLHADMEAMGSIMPSLEQESRLLALLVRWIGRHGDRRTAPSHAGEEPRAVSLVREYLHAHAHEDVRLETLSGVAGLSPFHLVRVFGRATGLPPHAFLMQCRVMQARTLLASDSSLAEVALACGFSDQSHLTRQFKKTLGITPGIYRKTIQDR